MDKLLVADKLKSKEEIFRSKKWKKCLDKFAYVPLCLKLNQPETKTTKTTFDLDYNKTLISDVVLYMQEP